MKGSYTKLFTGSSPNISFEILGGFAIALGVSAVAIALTALSLASLGTLIAAPIVVVGGLVAAAGFFSIKHGVTAHLEAEHIGHEVSSSLIDVK